MLVYQARNKKLPIVFNNYFIIIADIHSHNTNIVWTSIKYDAKQISELPVSIYLVLKYGTLFLHVLQRHPLFIFGAKV